METKSDKLDLSKLPKAKPYTGPEIENGCKCGAVIKAPARHAGKLARCPACGAAIRIKQPEK